MTEKISGAGVPSVIRLSLGTRGGTNGMAAVGQSKDVPHAPGKIVGTPGTYESCGAPVVQYLLELFESTCDYRASDGHIFKYFGRRAKECLAVRRNMGRGEDIAS